jgi:SAM-dependent methyltransferase
MGDYCIKDGYEHRVANATLEQNPGDYWRDRRMLLSRHAQHAVYSRAARLITERGLTTVIDVGCGLAHKLMDQIAPLAQVTGIDQPTAVEIAKQIHPKGRFVSDNFEEATSSLGTFDLVLCVDVIEHMHNPDVLLNYLAARCHKGSYVVVSTPERDVRRGKSNMKSTRPEHVREWNRDEFRRYLQTRGFQVISHELLPAFRVGWSPYMLKERWRLVRKGISVRYSQVAICRLAPTPLGTQLDHSPCQ